MDIKFYLNNKKDANGCQQVMARLYISRENRLRLKTGVWVHPIYFVDGMIIEPKLKRLSSVADREIAKEIKDKINRLSSFTSKLRAVIGSGRTTKEDILAAMDVTRNLSASDINDYTINSEQKKREEEKRVKEEEEKQMSMWDAWQLMIDRREKSGEVGALRIKAYKVMQRAMARYEMFLQLTENHDFRLNFNTMSADDMEDFFDYFRNEYSLVMDHKELFDKILESYPAEGSDKHKVQPIVERGHNTMVQREKAIKTLFHFLHDEGLTDNYPFRKKNKGKGTEHYGRVIALTKAEREHLGAFDLSADPKREKVRDIFYFQCCIGCRVSDLTKLRPSNIIDGAVVYTAQKTKDKEPEQLMIPLNSKARALVAKYEGVSKKGLLFPFLSAQKYNDELKKVFEVCGLDRIVPVKNPLTGEDEFRPLYEVASSHLARKTFVSCLYFNGNDVQLISEMSGHSAKSKAFERYNDIRLEMKQKAVEDM